MMSEKPNEIAAFSDGESRISSPLLLYSLEIFGVLFRGFGEMCIGKCDISAGIFNRSISFSSIDIWVGIVISIVSISSPR